VTRFPARSIHAHLTTGPRYTRLGTLAL
jgi:hypothetical protein